MDSLVIPVPLPSAPASHAEVYKARRGDTLVTIADRFGVSLDDLHRWNHASGISVVAGQRIRVSEPLHVAPHSRDRKRAGKEAASKESGSTSGSHKKTAVAASAKPAPRAATKSATKPSSKSSSKSRNDKAAHKSGESKKSNAHTKTARNKNVQK
jgi:membrane-bound lytic murein transglycosylase D